LLIAWADERNCTTLTQQGASEVCDSEIYYAVGEAAVE